MKERHYILIIGANGKTGSRIASRLEQLNYPVRRAGRSRNGLTEGISLVHFDWYDSATFTDALQQVRAVYMVAPLLDLNPAGVMVPFIKEAVQRGVQRFVLLSSASIPEGGQLMGQVHQALREFAPEWAVLQPSYFMENFTEGQHKDTIRLENTIYSAAGDGKIGFVSADDIAEVGVRALTDPHPHNRGLVITGPESLTYGDVALKISAATGRNVQHISLTEEELQARMISLGMSVDYAVMMSGLDTNIRENGTEDQVADTVRQVTGHSPIDLDSFIQSHKSVWI